MPTSDVSPATALVEQIASLFATKLNLDVPSVDSDLIGAGLLDSMGLVELLLLLEQDFGVKASLDDLDIANFGSIARIAEWVGAHLREARVPEA